jgi:hypothetical protein
MIDPVKAIAAAIETVRKLNEISAKIKDAETRNLIADLRNQLADVKLAMAELKEETADLREKLRSELQAKEAASADELEYRGGLNWRVSPKPGENPGPFCPNCSEEGRPVAVQKMAASFARIGKYRCPKCKAHFT